jgi:hypothetical protein
MWCFTINISGETYIEAGVPYMVTCSVSQHRDNRVTLYSAELSEAVAQTFIIAFSNSNGCYYQETGGYVPCQSGLCTCDMNGLATHWTFSRPDSLSSPVTIRCSSKDSHDVAQTSSAWKPTIARKCLVFMFYKFWCCLVR